MEIIVKPRFGQKTICKVVDGFITPFVCDIFTENLRVNKYPLWVADVENRCPERGAIKAKACNGLWQNFIYVDDLVDVACSIPEGDFEE